MVGGVKTVALRGAEDSGRVAERSESSNPMIASGNHTDSNNGRPYWVRRGNKKGRVKILPWGFACAIIHLSGKNRGIDKRSRFLYHKGIPFTEVFL